MCWPQIVKYAQLVWNCYLQPACLELSNNDTMKLYDGAFSDCVRETDVFKLQCMYVLEATEPQQPRVKLHPQRGCAAD